MEAVELTPLSVGADDDAEAHARPDMEETGLLSERRQEPADPRAWPRHWAVIIALVAGATIGGAVAFAALSRLSRTAHPSPASPSAEPDADRAQVHAELRDAEKQLYAREHEIEQLRFALARAPRATANASRQDWTQTGLMVHYSGYVMGYSYGLCSYGLYSYGLQVHYGGYGGEHRPERRIFSFTPEGLRPNRRAASE